MTDRASLAGVRRVVVKIGSQLIAEDPEGRTHALAAEAAALAARQIEVAIVSSGAIALGMLTLGLAERPRELGRLQAAAAVGQNRLIQHYEQALAAHRLLAAQVLLTHDDVRERGRYLNARHALTALIDLGAVPIINENDTVSVDEIKFGDNDRLAALVCSLIEADLLVILTDVDGLYDAERRVIAEVRDIEKIEALAGASTSGFGLGGMASKVQAAKMATRFGVPTVVASGRRPAPVQAVLAGEDVGTIFYPTLTRLQSRKQWIAFALKPTGRLVVDAGAARALSEHGKSLLPSGVVGVEGRFTAGDAVAIAGPDRREFARGLVAYSADELAHIRGHRSAELPELLGGPSVEEVVHRDDLVLL